MPLTAAIDGNDITDWCQKTTWKPVFNVIESGIVRLPAGVEGYTVGQSRLSLELNGTLKFDGPIWYAEPQGNPDAAYTELTAYDDRVYFGKRMAKNASGNLITPIDVIEDFVTAPEIMEAFIDNTISVDAALPIVFGTVDTGGTPLGTSAPMSWPMSLERLRQLLTATGQMDQQITPNGDGTTTLDLFNDWDNDLSGTVDFEYATGSFNCQIAKVTIDMKDVINALWYLLGPRCTDERWRGSITPTAPHPAGSWPAALVTRFMDSRSDYGYMQEIQVFDDQAGDCEDPMAGANAVRETFENQWAYEAWIRAVPRSFLSVLPERGIAPTNFRVGDLVGVAAGSILDGGFSGAQMVYGFTFSTDADGVDEFEEILTSADQVGAEPVSG